MKKPFLLLIATLFILLCTSCSKESQTPELTTYEVTDITQTSAVCGGEVTSEGCAKVTSRGVCWSDDHPPTIADAKTEDGARDGSFISNINGLAPSTTYFIRAYATNRYGTSYGSTMTITTPYGGELVTDIDGNIYHTITIGSQVWMLENLRVKHFRDGSPLDGIEDSLQWGSDVNPQYCAYGNSPSNEAVFGLLYNQKCVTDSRGLAPNGWHIPSVAEFQTLISFLGGETVAGGMLKEFGLDHWNSPNIGANNASGFTALPGGRRVYHGYFEGMGNFCNFWSSYPWWLLQINYNDPKTLLFVYPADAGVSVRCIKD